MEDTARKFRAAAVQISPVLFDRDATSEKVVEYVDRCGREGCLLYTSPSPRDLSTSRMPSSA